MSQSERELDEAIAEWLAAFEAHKRYLSATNRLFSVFAQSWQGSHRYLAEAFSDYREALLRNSGYSHSEVGEVFQTQRADNGPTSR